MIPKSRKQFISLKCCFLIWKKMWLWMLIKPSWSVCLVWPFLSIHSLFIVKHVWYLLQQFTICLAQCSTNLATFRYQLLNFWELPSLKNTGLAIDTWHYSWKNCIGWLVIGPSVRFCYYQISCFNNVKPE